MPDWHGDGPAPKIARGPPPLERISNGRIILQDSTLCVHGESNLKTHYVGKSGRDCVMASSVVLTLNLPGNKKGVVLKYYDGPPRFIRTQLDDFKARTFRLAAHSQLEEYGLDCRDQSSLLYAGICSAIHVYVRPITSIDELFHKADHWNNPVFMGTAEGIMQCGNMRNDTVNIIKMLFEKGIFA